MGGKIANGMGLLYLPKMKKLGLSNTESFVPCAKDVDFGRIAFKNKGRERQRMKLHEQNERQKQERLKKKAEKGESGKANPKKRRRKKSSGSHCGSKEKKVRRATHQLREFRHYQREEVMLRKLKRGQCTQEEFDKQMG